MTWTYKASTLVVVRCYYFWFPVLGYLSTYFIHCYQYIESICQTKTNSCHEVSVCTAVVLHSFNATPHFVNMIRCVPQQLCIGFSLRSYDDVFFVVKVRSTTYCVCPSVNSSSNIAAFSWYYSKANLNIFASPFSSFYFNN